MRPTIIPDDEVVRDEDHAILRQSTTFPEEPGLALYYMDSRNRSRNESCIQFNLTPDSPQ